MLEALEAPLADSRAAAVNIRLISCIGRQAKIGFCLQTRNSFNLLWSQCKSRFKIIEAKPLMSAQERRRNSEITTLDSLNPNLVLLARQSLTISLSATGSHYKWSLHTPSSHLFTDPTHQYHRVVLAVFGLALASMWRLYFSICTRPWLSVFSGGYQRQTRDSGTIKQNGPFSLSLIIHKRYIYYIFYLEWKWSEDEKQEYFTLAQKITTTYSLELSAGVCVCWLSGPGRQLCAAAAHCKCRQHCRVWQQRPHAPARDHARHAQQEGSLQLEKY